MRILVLSQYFTPEVTASRVRVHAFAAGLAARGHDVEVICEVPSHPAGVVYPGYGGRLVDRRSLDGFRVSYVWVRTSPTKTTASRLLLYASYAFAATALGVSKGRPDVILASSPPLPVAAAAAVIAARHRVPWVFDVRDLWPEAAVVLGELRGRQAIRAASWLEARLYESATAILTVTEPFRSEIAARVGEAKVHLLANGTTRSWLEVGAAAAPRADEREDERFVWMYAGNLGIAQGLDTAIEAAGILGDGFRLVLLGGGPQREQLATQASSLAGASVEFRDPVQPEVAAAQMRGADALLVSLDAQPELAKFVPSKLFDCCAVGRPVVLAASGEAPRLAGAAGAAIIVAPGDATELAGAVRRLRDDPSERERLADAGRRFASAHLREDQVEGLERLLLAISAGRR